MQGAQLRGVTMTALPQTDDDRTIRTFWPTLWAKIALSGALLVAVYFGAWEVFERLGLEHASLGRIHALHIVRGVGAALLLGTFTFASVRRAKLESDERTAAHLATLERHVLERGAALELVREANELLEAQVHHQEKMASLGILAAGFAHDLGNPLASLSTELELLKDETDLERFRESAAVLERHVVRMSTMLREIVDFARRRSDQVTDVSITAAVADSSRLVCHDPRWRTVKLEVDVPADLPTVRMVEDRLVLVLVNLMLNAADAMPDGGTLRIHAERAGKAVRVVVVDSGAGMSPAVLARAGTPMFTTKGAARGTGLGLAVSRRVLEGVGGRLDVASREGEGTTVTLTIPCDEVVDG